VSLGWECGDGTCATDAKSCSPYNGCDYLNPIMCANGYCVSDVANCYCNRNISYDNFLCYDGTCGYPDASSIDNRGLVNGGGLYACPVNPLLIVPIAEVVTVDNSVDSVIPLAFETFNLFDIFATIQVPAGTWSGTLEAVKVTGVGLSVLRTVSPPQGSNATGLSYIASIVFSITVHGGPVTFNHPVFFCFTTAYLTYLATPQTPLCLGYIDETANQWVCATNLTWYDNDTNLCGPVEHFTDYGVLFGSTPNEGESASQTGAIGTGIFGSGLSGQGDNLGLYVGTIAAAFVVIASIMIIGMVLLRRKKKKRFQEKESLTQKISNDSKRASENSSLPSNNQYQ